MKLFRYLFVLTVTFSILSSLNAQNSSSFSGKNIPVQPQQNPDLIGPVYPPPLGVNWSGSGNSANVLRAVEYANQVAEELLVSLGQCFVDLSHTLSELAGLL